MVLEHLADLAHAHVTCWYDNMPTVVWEASKLLASKAKQAAQLLRILVLHILACQAMAPITFHVFGKSNSMANFASKSFH